MKGKELTFVLLLFPLLCPGFAEVVVIPKASTKDLEVVFVIC
jgi:hypothetical protein